MREQEILAWKQFFHPQLEEVLLHKLDFEAIKPLEGGGNLADSAGKFCVCDRKGPAAVAFCAIDPQFDCVGQATKASVQCKELLDSSLGKHVLSPVAAGEWQGCSWAIYSYCTPLSDNRLLWPLQRKLLQGDIFHWLVDVAKETRCEAAKEEVDSGFCKPLEHIVSLSALSKSVREAATVSLHTLTTGAFKPCFSLMQGDFWKGNLLIDNRYTTVTKGAGWSKRFVIIDWAGARIKGYPFYDFIRFADSFRLRGHVLVESLNQFCHHFGCTPTQARSYLLAALGYLGLHLECFPFEQYLQLVEKCNVLMERALVAKK